MAQNTTSSDVILRARAISYAVMNGWHAFPVNPNQSTPATAHGFRDASDDVDTVTKMFARVPGANLGIRTGPESNLLVLDVDVKHDRPGMESLQALQAEHGELKTRMAWTPSGGLHYYFAFPEGAGIRNSVDRLALGLDIRSEGGYVLAPPSRRDGREYAWDYTHGSEVRPLPEWLLERLKSLRPQPVRPRPVSHVTQGSERLFQWQFRPVLEFLSSASQGERNTKLHWAACRLGEYEAQGLPAEWIEKAAEVMAGVAASIGLDEHGARATIASGRRNGADDYTTGRAA